MRSIKRQSGIPLVGELPWGTHFGQLYQTSEDRLAIPVPYLKAGLESNELCVWVISGTLDGVEPENALSKAAAFIGEYLDNGQLAIMPHSQWHAMGANPGGSIVSMLDRATRAGFDGLRLAFDAGAGGPGIADRELDAIGQLNVLALLAYHRDQFNALRFMEVTKGHRFTLVRDAGRWSVIESSEARIVRDELRKSEEKLQSLFSNMSEGFAYHRIVLDAEGRPCDYVFLEVNTAFERLTGLAARDVVGRRATQVLPGIESDSADWIGRYGKVAFTGQPLQFESYSQTLQRWYSVSVFSRQQGFFAVIFSDITERRLAEQRTARHTAVLTGMARIFREALTCQSEDELGRVCLAVAEEVTQSKFGFLGEINPQTGKLDDIAISDPGWEACQMATPAGHGGKLPVGLTIHGLYGRVLTDGKGFFTNDPAAHPDRIGTPPGHPSLRAFLGVPLVQSGRTIGMVGLGNREGGYGDDQLEAVEALAPVIVQVFLRKRAEEQSRAAKLSAEQANQAKDHFLAVLSHELRTPLNPALMAATILERSPQLPPALREDVGVIRRNVELEARLIDDLLDLTRIARGKLMLNRRIVDGREVLGHAIETCRADAVEKALDLQIMVPERPLLVDADPARLQQVFWNLIKNAIKFTPDHGRIAITAAATKTGGLCVSVCDTGRGIEPQALTRIFDAFEQGGSTITRRYGGLGLGLAICKGLVARHDGTIHARSEGPGKGATFIVELPPPARHDEGAVPPHAACARDRAHQASGGCRILLVEDHQSTAIMTARLLQSFGHEVVTADSVKRGAERFAQEPVDLVISDLGLPDGSGHDLLRRLLAQRLVPAIALSGYGMDGDIQQSIQAGFLEHLTKPINARQLQDAIERALGKTRNDPAATDHGGAVRDMGQKDAVT